MAEKYCTKCGQRPVSRQGKCRDCLAQWQREYRARCRQEGRCQACGKLGTDGKVHCAICRGKRKTKEHGRKQQGLCVQCGQHPPAPGRTTRCEKCKQFEMKCKEKYREQGLCHQCGRMAPELGYTRCNLCLASMKRHRMRYRSEAIQAYGGQCRCCGETQLEFLQLDHVNNDGAEHRRQIGKGTNIYLWAKDHGYPPILQVLCANCHNALSFYGYCPHHPGKETRHVTRRKRNRPASDPTS